MMNDDTLRAALETRRWLERHPEIHEVFNSIGRAPLATLVDQYVAQYPNAPFARHLRDLASLDAGTLADLDAGDFVEYVTQRTALSRGDLNSCRHILTWYDGHGNDIGEDLRLRAASLLERTTDEPR